MTEKQQELALQLLTEIVDALGDKHNLSMWETTILANAKNILKNE